MQTNFPIPARNLLQEPRLLVRPVPTLCRFLRMVMVMVVVVVAVVLAPGRLRMLRCQVMPLPIPVLQRLLIFIVLPRNPLRIIKVPPPAQGRNFTQVVPLLMVFVLVQLQPAKHVVRRRMLNCLVVLVIGCLFELRSKIALRSVHVHVHVQVALSVAMPVAVPGGVVVDVIELAIVHEPLRSAFAFPVGVATSGRIPGDRSADPPHVR